jgi:hypothetical protein
VCILCGNCAYLLNALHVFVTRSFCFISRFFIDGMCMMTFMRDVKTLSGATFHLIVTMSSMSN